MADSAASQAVEVRAAAKTKAAVNTPVVATMTAVAAIRVATSLTARMIMAVAPLAPDKETAGTTANTAIATGMITNHPMATMTVLETIAAPMTTMISMMNTVTIKTTMTAAVKAWAKTRTTIAMTTMMSMM